MSIRTSSNQVSRVELFSKRIQCLVSMKMMKMSFQIVFNEWFV